MESGKRRATTESEDRRKVYSTEPQFADQTVSLSLDVVQDQLSILNKDNGLRINRAIEFDQLFMSPRAVDYLFTLCARLRLPQDVKYIAAIIFDQFMLAHVDQMYGWIHELPLSDSKKHKEWKRVETTIAHQLTLRALSSVQIASKLHSFHHGLSTKNVVECLETLGLAYTEESVLNSELRILKTLDFHIPSPLSPLVYVETLLKLLYLANEELKAQDYWSYCLLLLDTVFLHHEAVYKRLMDNLLGLAAQSITRERMAFVKADWMLLAAGIIAAASVCVDGDNRQQRVIEDLHKLTSSPAADIADVSLAIRQHILAAPDDCPDSSRIHPSPG